MLGPRQVVAYAKRFGFPEDFPPYLSTALGAAEATLLEMTSAYTAFPNQGIRLQPYQVMSVVDRETATCSRRRGRRRATRSAPTRRTS